MVFNFFKIRKGEKKGELCTSSPPRSGTVSPAWGLGRGAGGRAVAVGGGGEAEPLGFGEPLTELMASLWLPFPMPREGHLDPPEGWLGSPHPNII